MKIIQKIKDFLTRRERVPRFTNSGGRKPKKGFFDNPLVKYPRNFQCFCGSKRKYKKCCMRSVNPYVNKKDYRINKSYIKYIMKVRRNEQ